MWGNTHIENRRLNLLTTILTSYSMTIGEKMKIKPEHYAYMKMAIDALPKDQVLAHKEKS